MEKTFKIGFGQADFLNLLVFCFGFVSLSINFRRFKFYYRDKNQIESKLIWFFGYEKKV